MRRALALVALAAAACSGGAAPPTISSPAGAGELLVIRASSDLAVGSERVLLGLAHPDGSRLGGPGLDATMITWPEADEAQRRETAASWIWAIPGRSGLYAATVEFDREGVWMVQLALASGPQPEPIPLFVSARSLTPSVGAAAPRSTTPTAFDAVSIAEISSDPRPNPRFYSMSVAEAVTSGRSSVVVFATPRFCQTAICGPTLEIVKEAAADYPSVNFVHVEVYDLAASPADAASIEELAVSPAVLEWGLPSEPWVFVVDPNGFIAGRFEGVIAPQELASLLG